RLGFALESLAHLGLGIGRQMADLEGHIAVESAVVGQINGAHPSFTQMSDDLIRTKGVRQGAGGGTIRRMGRHEQRSLSGCRRYQSLNYSWRFGLAEHDLAETRMD